MRASLITALLSLSIGSPAAALLPSAAFTSVEGAATVFSGPASGGAAVDRKSESKRALQAGQQALERGEWEQAAGHFERAVAGDPRVRKDALLGLAEVARNNRDDDGLARAALAWSDLVVTADGKASARAPRGVFDARNGELDLVRLGSGVARARARAVEELVRLAGERESKGSRNPEQLLTAAWARRFALDLALQSPAIQREARGQLAPEVHAPRGAHVPVLKALQRVAEDSLSRAQPGLALRAARIMRGLGAQADFKDLRGPRPSGMPRWRAKGVELAGRARGRMEDGSGKPWTVEELEWLASDEGEAFTRKHSDFSEPGVAVSPRGWYRVESDCGYETLLGVASTVEKHHERLAAYFGSDPFNGRNPRQGIVRIVPDPSGLEAEGAPFFWAGGFQGGDTTVLQFSVGTIPGLGRGLTHELTHRFDGALHGGIPAWLAEGRATWTGAAYAFTDDPEFAFDYCSPGTLRGVLRGGDASLANLEAILRGEPEDYRKNYSVGNALYVFLSTWFEGDARKLSEGTPIFAERLVEFEDSGDHSSSPKGRLDDFEDQFCDGEDGRPSSIDGFQEMFAEFLAGFDVKEPADWTARYRSGFAKTERGDWVYDEPTWTWDWNRAEPVFGQNQAREAGLLLAEHGDRAAAIRALVWARAVDGYDLRIARGLEQALGAPSRPKNSESEALWVTTHERRGEPFLGVLQKRPGRSFPGALPAVWDYHEQVLAAADALASAGLAGSSARLRIEALRVAAWAGIEGEGDALGDSAASPLPGLAAELEGWRDEELTSLDKNRPKGLYRIEPDGGLLLGRRQRQAGTGDMDRGGGGKSFLRADRWMLPGSYSVSTRVSFTTASNSFLAVLGWTSRERNVRLRLTATDWDYATGKKDTSPEFKSVNWAFDGLRTRDGGLPGSARSGAVSVTNSQTSVQLELLVEGSAVSAWIAGQYAGTYHTIDGAPIEGYVGFGTASGAVALSPPITRRTDGEPARAAGTASDLAALDLARGTGPSFEKVNNQRVLFQGEREPSSNGTLLLWIPAHSKSEGIRERRSGVSGDGATIARIQKVALSLISRMLRRDIVQPMVLLLPERLAEASEEAGLAEELAEAAGELSAPTILYHKVAVEDAADAAAGIDQGRRWIMFLDSSDIIREAQPWIGAVALDNPKIDHWLTVFRDHGRPARALPEVQRDPEDEEAEEDEDS